MSQVENPSILATLQEFVTTHYLQCFILSVLLWILKRAVYNVYFHPLAKFPGPFLGSITDLYLAYIITSVPTFGLELHKKHGPIVRLAPDLLSFSDPKLLPKVYHKNADKPHFYGSWMFGTTAAMFQSLSHHDHAAKKRLVSSCCSLKAIREYESRINYRVDELCHKIRQRSAITGKSLDFSEHVRWFLTDVWSELVYGEPIGCVKMGADAQGLLDVLQGVYAMSATAAVIPWLQPLLRSAFLRRHIWAWTRTFRCMDRLHKHFDAMLQRRQQCVELKQKNLFFDRLNPSGTPTGSAMSREDLRAEVITFSAATLDGVAAFICPFINNMIEHPEVRARVIAEIDAAQRSNKLTFPVVSYDETTALPYFIACINETLRRDAPAQTILPRLVSKGGYEINGQYIPEGMQMGASPFIIHRDASIFGPDPEEFRPERWLKDPALVTQMEKYGMWWGYGDRECAGKYYAQVEMQKLLLELLRRFEFAPARNKDRYLLKREAVAMFWNFDIFFKDRKIEQKREVITSASAGEKST